MLSATRHHVYVDWSTNWGTQLSMTANAFVALHFAASLL